jgi:hypothetical protein
LPIVPCSLQLCRQIYFTSRALTGHRHWCAGSQRALPLVSGRSGAKLFSPIALCLVARLVRLRHREPSSGDCSLAASLRNLFHQSRFD